MSWQLLTSSSKIIRSNGNLAVWGQSWSACSSFVLAGHKARDARLSSLLSLKTVIPLHCAIDLYGGDIHYIDGIMHCRSRNYAAVLWLLWCFSGGQRYIQNRRLLRANKMEGKTVGKGADLVDIYVS